MKISDLTHSRSHRGVVGGEWIQHLDKGWGWKNAKFSVNSYSATRNTDEKQSDKNLIFPSIFHPLRAVLSMIFTIFVPLKTCFSSPTPLPQFLKSTRYKCVKPLEFTKTSSFWRKKKNYVTNNTNWSMPGFRTHTMSTFGCKMRETHWRQNKKRCERNIKLILPQ